MSDRPTYPGLGELPIEQPPSEFKAERRLYLCHRTETPLVIDGRMDEESWNSARWTGRFVDILGPDDAFPDMATRVKMLWDPDYLYVAAELEETDVWGTITVRDSPIFRDNDFEVFIDPDADGKRYVELEINALNTIFDVFVDRPFAEGGLPDVGFDFAGLRHAVRIDGSLNWPEDTDRGWTVELAFPWTSLRGLTEGSCPPVSGDVWRMNFGRVHWDRQKVGGHPLEDCGMSVWAPPGAFNMHVPENWGYVAFTDDGVGT